MTLGLRELWNTAGAAIRVQAECSRLNRISYPRWERVQWEIPARSDMPPVTITWHHGPDYAPGTRELIHEKMRQFGMAKPEDADALMKNAGSILVGSEGALVADDHSVHVTVAAEGQVREARNESTAAHCHVAWDLPRLDRCLPRRRPTDPGQFRQRRSAQRTAHAGQHRHSVPRGDAFLRPCRRGRSPITPKPTRSESSNTVRAGESSDLVWHGLLVSRAQALG